jgi:large subunit ribosomal protein L22
MDIRATSQYVRISPRKLRLVAGAVKPLSVAHALSQLKNMDKRAAVHLHKTLKSCVANAIANAKAKEEDLVIKSILIDEGPSFKRFQPVARGMAHSFKKRTSHITVILSTKTQVALPRPKADLPLAEKGAKKEMETKIEEPKEVKKVATPKKVAAKKGVARGTKSKS